MNTAIELFIIIGLPFSVYVAINMNRKGEKYYLQSNQWRSRDLVICHVMFCASTQSDKEPSTILFALFAVPALHKRAVFMYFRR